MTTRPLIIAGAIIIASAMFSFWPMKPTTFETPVIERAQTVQMQVAVLDLSAFRAPIWVAEPPPLAPTAPAAPPPPQPPLRLQLLAIIRDSDPGSYRAAVYDPDSDRILVVAAGQKLGTRTVEEIDKSTLTLKDEGGKRVLALNDGGVP